jgi:hypothetical protein
MLQKNRERRDTKSCLVAHHDGQKPPAKYTSRKTKLEHSRIMHSENKIIIL